MLIKMFQYDQNQGITLVECDEEVISQVGNSKTYINKLNLAEQYTTAPDSLWDYLKGLGTYPYKLVKEEENE